MYVYIPGTRCLPAQVRLIELMLLLHAAAAVTAASPAIATRAVLVAATLLLLLHFLESSFSICIYY